MVESLQKEESGREGEVLVDADRGEIHIDGRVTIEVVDEGGVMEIDHTSNIDGYVAFCSDNNSVSLTFRDD